MMHPGALLPRHFESTGTYFSLAGTPGTKFKPTRYIISGLLQLPHTNTQPTLDTVVADPFY